MTPIYSTSAFDATLRSAGPIATPPLAPPLAEIVPIGSCKGRPLSTLSNADLAWFTTTPLKSRTFAAAVSAELERRGPGMSAPVVPTTPVPQPRPSTPDARLGWRDEQPTERQRAVLTDRGLWRNGLTKGEASDLLDCVFGKVTR